MPDTEPAPATNRPALPNRPFLHGLSLIVVAATFLLIAIGGNVTSLDAGMVFKEGWTTGGYWSLLAPPAEWLNNLAQAMEHTHRLQGYVVGNLFIALVLWLWVREWWLAKRRGEWVRKWLPIVGTSALLLVVAQGVLGAVRVDMGHLTHADSSVAAPPTAASGGSETAGVGRARPETKCSRSASHVATASNAAPIAWWAVAKAG
jgi:hypothetical protein